MNQTNATLKCALSAFLLVWMSTLQDAHSQDTSSLSLDGAFSGLWFNPDFNGQGFQFQIFGDESNPQLFAVWYTHLDGEPTWLFGIGPATSNPTTLQMAQVIGGEFPPDFDAGATSQQVWGSLTIERTDDSSARATWASNSDPAIAGNMALTQLTQVSGEVSRSCLSGSWFNVSQSGHGWLSEVIESNGQAELVATWYAHLDGQPTWVLAQGPFDGRVAEVQAIQTTGSQFPPDFNPDDVQIAPWGAMRFEFINDDQALVSWQPTDTRFSNGILTTQRLTAVSGIECETDRTLNNTAAQLNTFYAPHGGRDAFPEHYVKSIETFLAAQDEIEQGDLNAASTRIEALFQEQPLSTGIWFDQATLNDLNVGSPIAYYGLRMMETIVNPPPQTRSGSLNFTALVASCASVERPTLPSLAPETVELTVHPDILANDSRVLHQSTDLFRRWLTAITGGMDINFSVVETTDCTTVDFQVGDGIILSYPDSNGMVESPATGTHRPDRYLVGCRAFGRTG